MMSVCGGKFTPVSLPMLGVLEEDRDEKEEAIWTRKNIC